MQLQTITKKGCNGNGETGTTSEKQSSNCDNETGTTEDHTSLQGLMVTAKPVQLTITGVMVAVKTVQLKTKIKDAIVTVEPVQAENTERVMATTKLVQGKEHSDFSGCSGNGKTCTT